MESLAMAKLNKVVIVTNIQSENVQEINNE
jgi:hypothetical protein